MPDGSKCQEKRAEKMNEMQFGMKRILYWLRESESTLLKETGITSEIPKMYIDHSAMFLKSIHKEFKSKQHTKESRNH